MQLAGLFPGSYYNNDESKALDFMGYFAHQRQQQEAFKNQELNRQAALEDLFHKQQMNPIARQQAQVNVDTSRAQLPGIEADSAGKVANRKLADSVPFEEQRKALLTKLARETSEADLANEKAQMEKWIISPTTPEPVRQRLIQARDMMKEIYQLKQSLASKETVASTQVNRPRPAPAPAAPKLPRTLEELEAQLRARGEIEQADVIKEQIRQRIQDKANAVAAGKVDISAATDGAVPVRPGITSTPSPAVTGRPARQADSKTVRMQDASGKFYNIPASRKDEALKDGLKLAE